MVGRPFKQAVCHGRVLLGCLLAASVAGCGVGDVRYAGPVSVTQGVCGQGFDAQGRASATLVVRGPEVRYAPSDGVTVLDGHVTDAGHVLAGSTVAGADKKPFVTVFEGDRKDDRVHGTYATPRCRATVDLTRR